MNKLFKGNLRADLYEANADVVQFTKNGTGNGLSNIKETFAESLQLQMPLVNQSMYIFKADLSSSRDSWAKYKEKESDVSDPNQNVEKTCSSKLNFT